MGGLVLAGHTALEVLGMAVACPGPWDLKSHRVNTPSPPGPWHLPCTAVSSLLSLIELSLSLSPCLFILICNILGSGVITLQEAVTTRSEDLSKDVEQVGGKQNFRLGAPNPVLTNHSTNQQQQVDGLRVGWELLQTQLGKEAY